MAKNIFRRGYTLFELVVVMAILLILAIIILPSIGAFRGDSRPRAAADMIRGELAAARARAKDEGRPYRVAISEDGTRIRRAPDDMSFPDTNAFSQADDSAAAVDYTFENVKAAVVIEENTTTIASPSGWTTLACVQPDGTCRDDNILVSLTDDDGTALHLRIRGVTGRSQVVLNPNTTNGSAP